MKNLIFVPIGSYEQHGPHLPPDTDYLIAKKIVQILSPKFNGIINKGIEIGISPEHEEFKNTKSITVEEFKYHIDKILEEYQNNCKFILINAHGGNNTTLLSIQESYKNKVLVANIFSIIKEDLLIIRTSKIGGICHAGEFETSIMLYLYPNMVKMDVLQESDVTYIPALDPNYEDEKIKKWKTIHYSKSGILGDPFHATASKGEIWMKILIMKIMRLIEDFISRSV